MIEIRLLSVEDVKSFVRVAKWYEGDVNLIKGSVIVDGKDIDGLFGVDASHGVEVELLSNDYDKQMEFEFDMQRFGVK